MEIFGFGSGSGGYGRRNDRREAFRRKHVVGQRVIGIFERWQSDSLAWVQVDGHPLLAQLGGSPQPGQRLFFIIKALHPDIVLQEFVPETGGSGGLANHAQVFWDARTGFETLLLQHADILLAASSPQKRKKKFQDMLREQPALGASYAKLLQSVEGVDTWLHAHGQGRLLLLPWLMPKAREQELLLASDTQTADQNTGLRRLIFAFTLPAIGACEVRALLRPPQGRYRIFLERMEHAARVQEQLAGMLRPVAGWELEAGGVGQLQPGVRGVIAPLLRLEAERSVPRFSTRV